MPAFKRNSMIPLKGGGQIKITDYISEGGQGEVYRVLYNGGEYALKWYSKLTPSEQFYDNLAHNIKLGAPNEYFLWPLALTEKIRGRFGYVMRLRPKNYREYGEFLLDEARFASWDCVFRAALNITESYFTLHSMGYSYQDLNEGSFFIDPNNGDVLICDNDNVAPFGVNLGVKGMPKYMAPEVVTDKSRPNTHTDRFSLAIILFRLFYIDHPLEGRYTAQFPITDEIGAQLFGENPIFVYDPKNKTNRPDPEAHANVIKRWHMFPPDLNAAFIKSFTDGLRDINSRVTEHQWREILMRARGMLVKIGGREMFVNAYDPKSVPKECKLLRTEEQIIALAPESVLYKCQLDRLSPDYKTAAAVVKASSKRADVYGLGNLTDTEWTAQLPAGSPAAIKPKSFVPLISGTVIDFGTVKGKVF